METEITVAYGFLVPESDFLFVCRPDDPCELEEPGISYKTDHYQPGRDAFVYIESTARVVLQYNSTAGIGGVGTMVDLAQLMDAAQPSLAEREALFRVAQKLSKSIWCHHPRYERPKCTAEHPGQVVLYHRCVCS